MNRRFRQIPEGMQDTLPGECLQKRALEGKLRALFSAHGFKEAKTPLIEYFDVFFIHNINGPWYKIAKDCKSFEYIKKPFNTQTKLIVGAALSSIFSILIMGMFDYVWYNYRVFFLFWAALALGVACIRVGKKEHCRSNGFNEYDDYTSSLDVIL